MKILKFFIEQEIRKKLEELKLNDLINQIGQQRSQNFYNHPKHYNFMRKVGEAFPHFISFNDGIMKFEHPASGEWQETANNIYKIYIKFYNWDNMQTYFEQNLSTKDIVNELFEGDLGIFCSCKSFWNHYSYAATQKKADVILQTIPAPIKNPNLVGVGCKHCEAVLNKQMLKFQFKVISTSIEKMKKSDLEQPQDDEI